MGLTAGWMGLAGGAALLVAVRSRDLRWPVLGAYAVTAAVAGVYLGSSVVLDDVVDERVATAPAIDAPALRRRRCAERVQRPAPGAAASSPWPTQRAAPRPRSAWPAEAAC